MCAYAVSPGRAGARGGAGQHREASVWPSREGLLVWLLVARWDAACCGALPGWGAPVAPLRAKLGCVARERQRWRDAEGGGKLAALKTPSSPPSPRHSSGCQPRSRPQWGRRAVTNWLRREFGGGGEALRCSQRDTAAGDSVKLVQQSAILGGHAATCVALDVRGAMPCCADERSHGASALRVTTRARPAGGLSP